MRLVFIMALNICMLYLCIGSGNENHKVVHVSYDNGISNLKKLRHHSHHFVTACVRILRFLVSSLLVATADIGNSAHSAAVLPRQVDLDVSARHRRYSILLPTLLVLAQLADHQTHCIPSSPLPHVFHITFAIAKSFFNPGHPRRKPKR